MLHYLSQNIDITNFSGYKTKAFAKYFFELKNSEDFELIPEIMDFVKKENLKCLFLWWGMNCLFAFDIFDGVVIKNNLKWFNIKDKKYLEINSWENVIYLVSRLEKDYWILNLKPWNSLPGSIWGAVVGNAWCFGLEVKDIFISARIYDIEENKIIEINPDFMEFGYRSSILKNNKRYFIISTKLDISKNVDNFFTEEFRFKNQPKWYSCGSVFKNPIWSSAWRLIDEAGLKWENIGWAKISEIHANFIVSDWKAQFNDILNLMNLAKKLVFEKFWIKLEEEINLIN